MNRKKMSLFDSILMAVGSIIGASIFATTPIGAKIVGGNGVVWGFIFAAIFVFLRTWPEMVLSSTLPATGGGYMQSSRLVHPLVGTFVSIGNLILGPMKVATMALTFASYFKLLVPSWNPIVVAVAITLIFTIINLFGIRIASWLQNLFVAVMVIALGAYVVMGWGHTVVTLGAVLSTTFQLSKMWAAMGIMHGSLIGANALMYIADDVDEPGKNIPLAFIISTSLTAIFFAAIAYVTVGVMPNVFKIDNLATVAKVFMGSAMWAFFIVGGALLAVVTSLTPAMLMFSSSHLVSAKDGLYPEFMGKINNYGAPANALWVNSIIAILAMVASFNLTDVINITTIPGLLLSPAVFIAVFFLPKRFPASYKTSWLNIPHWLNCIGVVVATAVCFLLGWAVLAQMLPKNYITMIVVYAIFVVYVWIRSDYLKRKGINMFDNMRRIPESWTAREKVALEELSTKNDD
jgi:amino acid transporter